jgi:hypothetical protein
MKTNRPRHANRTGGILPLVMMILVAFTLLVVALLQLGRNSAQEAEYQYNTAQAFALAEAGLEEFKAILEVSGNRRPIPNNLSDRSLSNNVSGAGSYSVVVTDDPDWDNVLRVIKKYIITSTGRARNGAVQAVSIRAAIKTFGDYLWATLNENNVWFTTGDLLRGPVRTDDRLNINGTPRFFALVESAANSVNYNNGGSPAVFEGGLDLGVPPLDWTSVQQQVNNLSIDPMAQTLSGDYDITFADTSVILHNRAAGSPTTTNAIDSGRIYYVTGDAHVQQGTVGTRVTVVTPGSIFIEGDITYQSAADEGKPADPSQWGVWAPDKTEALGLYSQTLVEIVYPSPDNRPVNIHAAILVPNGSFRAADRNVNIGMPYINFYGSLGQNVRGAVGTTAGAGYLKNYNYDSRFGEAPPPGIPYSSFYFSEWKQL